MLALHLTDMKKSLSGVNKSVYTVHTVHSMGLTGTPLGLGRALAQWVLDT